MEHKDCLPRWRRVIKAAVVERHGWTDCRMLVVAGTIKDHDNAEPKLLLIIEGDIRTQQKTRAQHQSILGLFG